jgi:formylglycine-generating enzyme required for sulfatase activity/serine/threonine protein kinase
MDAKARFKQLQEAYTAGYLENAEFNELRAALLSIMHRATSALEQDSAVGIEEGEAPPAELWKLERDLEIGPPTRRFRLMRKLGNGCAAYQTWLGDDVNAPGPIDERLRLLKIFAPPKSPSDKPGPLDPQSLAAFLARIKTRVELATLLDHPHIAKVYGWRRDKAGWLFAEAEYIDHRANQSLEKLLETQGKPGLSWGLVLELIRPTVAALTHAQRDHRLAHRNLKPATLFRNEQDAFKVVDFALNVQTRDADENPSFTGRPEPLLSTAAPSTVGQSRFKRDVGDLCATILHLLTGQPWTVEAQRPKLARLTKPAQLTNAAWQLLKHGLAGHGESCSASAEELLQRLEAAQAIPDNAAGESLLKSRSSSRCGSQGPSAGPQSGGGQQEELFANYLYRLTAGMEIGPPDRRFRLLRRLGDTGRVWLAAAEVPDKEPRDRPHKALKVFAPESTEELLALSGGSEESGTLSRAELLNLRAALVHLRAKVEVAALLNHPNIIRVYGWRQGKDGWPFVEMDYLDNRAGYNLQQLLQREGVLDWERVLGLLRPIASALDYAHQTHRLAHRNLRPTNVVVTHQDEVTLLDFGLTYQPRELREGIRTRDAEGARRETGAEAGAGALAFKQDVGALAALAYEMLSGEPPYAEEELLGRDPHTWPPMTAGHEASKARPASAEPPKPPGLNDAAWQILRRSLDYRDAECPTHAGELLRRLEAAQAPRRGHERRGTSAPAGQSSWPRGLAAVLLLAVLGGAIAYGLYTWYPASVSNRAPVRNGPPLAAEPPVQEQSPAGPAQADAQPGESQRIDDPEADLQAFEAARRLATVSAYQVYLQRCPNCAYQTAAEQAIIELQRSKELTELTSQFETHLAAWQRDEGQRRDLAAKAVLDKLVAFDPRLPLIADGRRRLALSYVGRVQAGIAAGQFAAAQQWLSEAQALQPDLPQLQALPEAIAQAREQARAQREQAQAQQQDNAAFQRARGANTRQAYRDYLARCHPLCGHEQAAHAALEALKLQAPSTANPVFRDRLKNGGLGPDMMLIPTGEFWMGSPAGEAGRYADEERQPVRIPRAFGLSLYEISFDEYDGFARATGRALPDDSGWGRGRRPVINISWEDADAYARWLAQSSGHRYRLPTEAEWEYAARAGTAAARFWGDDPDAGCRYANGSDLTALQTFAGWTVMRCQDGYLNTAPVGSYEPNAWGLHDMLGNAMELTCSAYEGRRQATTHACNATAAVPHVVARGGSWSDEPRNMRAAERFKAPPQMKTNFLGFRVLREL